MGARISFITSDQWRDRDAIMEAHRRDYASRDERAYVVPEGGSNALGAIGYAMAARELLADEASRGIRIAHVVHATGSGGTTAGLALGFAMLGREDVDVCAIAVCDDAQYFDARIRSILDEAVDRKLVTRADADRARWRVVEGYKGTGYAQTTPEEMRAQRGLAMRDGIIVDPVYTGKAYLGLLGEATASRLSGATVFLHTGGIFELFAYASEIGRLAKAQ